MSDFLYESKTNRLSSDENSVGNIFHREMELLSSVPQTVFTGLCERVNEIRENPFSAVGMQVIASAAIGAGLAVITKNPKAFVEPFIGHNSDKFIAGAKKLLPVAGTLMLVGDVSMRTAPVMWDTATNANHLEANKKLLGYNLGSMAIDYPLTGLAGTGGALAVDVAGTLRPGLAMSSKVMQSSLMKGADFNSLRPAYAGGVGEEVISKQAGEGLADSTVFFKKREWNLPTGEKIELHDDGNAILHKGSSSSNYKYKPVDNRLELLYKPFEDIGQMLNSIIIADSTSLEPFYMVRDLLNGKSFAGILKHFQGKWEPEYSTNTCIELRSNYTGEIANLKKDYGSKNSPLVIQPLEKIELPNCSIEKLPEFTRPYQQWNSDWKYFYENVYPSEFKPLAKTLQGTGFRCDNADPLLWGQLKNGWKVILDPRKVYTKEYPGAWEEIDHQSAVRLYSAGLRNLTSIYGETNPAIGKFKERLGNHFAALGQNDKARRLFEETLQVQQQSGDLNGAHNTAKSLFYLFRNMSDYGEKTWAINKAEYYAKLSSELYQKWATSRLDRSTTRTPLQTS
ncbi:MAG: tetratricopeptide repeat protein [Candidatus Obscuribacterales bacterium]|nr:tetratricopeptide repeat protein [Candidatus Obscuribacterales bacterium]